MDICGWRLLRAGHSTRFSSVWHSTSFGDDWNCHPRAAILVLHLSITGVTKFCTEQWPLCHFYKLFSDFPPLQAGTAFTLLVCARGPWHLSSSVAKAVTAGEQTQSPAQCPSWKQAVTVSLSLSCSPSSAMMWKARQFRICTHSCPCYSPAEAN